MKRLWLFFVMLFLAACGSGGDGGGGTKAETSLKMGTLNVQLRDGTAKIAALAPSFPQRVRIVVNNPTLSIGGKSFHVVRDEAIGYATPVTFTLPVHSGYQIEALYYAFDSSDNNVRVLQKYASSGATVAADGVTGVILNMDFITPPDITPSPMALQAHVPGDVTAAQTSTLTATIADTGTPLQKGWAAHLTTAEPTAPAYGGSPSLSHVVKAPDSFSNGTIYVQPQFFMKSSLLDTDNHETVNNWTFIPTYDPDNDSIQEYYAKAIAVTVSGVSFPVPGGLFDDTVAPEVTSFSVPTAVQTTTLVSPIRMAAIDDAGATQYRIRQTMVASSEAAAKADAARSIDPAAAFTTGNYANITNEAVSYAVTGGINDAVDNYVQLSVQVKDASGKVSPWSAWKTVVINNKPVIRSFSSPGSVLLPADNSAVPSIDFTGIVASGTGVQFAVTLAPASGSDSAPVDGWSSTNSATILNVPTTNLSHAKDNLVKFNIWAKSGTVTSDPVAAYVHINDLPKVTTFDVPSALQTSRSIPVFASGDANTLRGIVFAGAKSANRPGATLRYLIKENPITPATDDFKDSYTSYAIASTSYGIKQPKSDYVLLYAFVYDGTAISAPASKMIWVSVP